MSAIDQPKRDEYFVKLEISLDKLQNLPKGQGSTAVVISLFLQMCIQFGEQNGGFAYDDQKVFHKVRYAFDETIKTQMKTLILSKKEFEFLDMCRRKGKTLPTANEAVIRVGELLDDSICDWEKRNPNEVGGYQDGIPNQ